jgi:hypothetical protein
MGSPETSVCSWPGAQPSSSLIVKSHARWAAVRSADGRAPSLNMLARDENAPCAAGRDRGVPPAIILRGRSTAFGSTQRYLMPVACAPLVEDTWSAIAHHLTSDASPVRHDSGGTDSAVRHRGDP